MTRNMMMRNAMIRNRAMRNAVKRNVVKRNMVKQRVVWLILAVLLLLGVGSGCGYVLGEGSSCEAMGEGTFVSMDSAESQTESTPAIPLTIHFLDVGAADSILLEQNGRYLMIDAGDGEDMERITGYLDSLGVERLDGLLLTHMHADHIGSAAGILETYGSEQVWMQDYEMDTAAYRKLKDVLERNRISVTEPEAGDSFTWQDCQFTVLGPLGQYEDYNNQSLVVCMEFGSHRYLFTGDMEQEAEEDLLAVSERSAGLKSENAAVDGGSVDYRNLMTAVTVLKAGHHGSNSSSCEAFLELVRPQITVIPRGKGAGADEEDSAATNGTMADGEGLGGQALARLLEYSQQVYGTDEGTVILTDDGQTLQVAFAKGELLPTRFWIGNVKTGVYHRSDCKSLPAVQNRCYFAQDQDAVSKGYRPCGSCVKETQKAAE